MFRSANGQGVAGCLAGRCEIDRGWSALSPVQHGETAVIRRYDAEAAGRQAAGIFSGCSRCRADPDTSFQRVQPSREGDGASISEVAVQKLETVRPLRSFFGNASRSSAESRRQQCKALAPPLMPISKIRDFASRRYFAARTVLILNFSPRPTTRVKKRCRHVAARCLRAVEGFNSASREGLKGNPARVSGFS